MADFDADIELKVNSTAAERQVKKLERSISKVEDTSRDILAVEKRIVVERRKLLGLSKTLLPYNAKNSNFWVKKRSS